MTGPYTRIVLNRGTHIDIIGRPGHIDPHSASRMFAASGKVVVVRHEMMRAGGRPETAAIHRLR